MLREGQSLATGSSLTGQGAYFELGALLVLLA